jgi:hypothetical protein
VLPTDRRRDRPTTLVGRLLAADPSVAAEILGLAPRSADPELLVVAAVVSGDRAHLIRASNRARSARQRQVIALADARLRGDQALFDVLVREHLAEYPDHLLASWMAGEPCPPGPAPPPTRS